jgi:negative regulator of sigma E activity
LGYRLALDDASGLILKSESFSEDGTLLERHEYASLTVTPKDENSEAEGPTLLMQHLDIVGLPFGYKASLARGFEEKALFVSDGIAAATVVFEPLPDDLLPGEGAVRHGATLTYSRGSVVSGTGVLVTVIGEVPLPAARLIAEAVRVVPGR